MTGILGIFHWSSRSATRPLFIIMAIMSSARGLLSKAALAASFLFFAACGDSTPEVGSTLLKSLDTGISADSVYRIIGTGPLQPVTASDSIRIVNGFRRSRYFLNGASYDVIWYREASARIDSAINVSEVSPILLKDDSVQGWGWKYFDKATTEVGLPNPKTTPSEI